MEYSEDSRAARLARALDVLGIDIDQPAETDLLFAVQLANGLLGSAERECLEAEMDLGDRPDAEQECLAAEHEADAAAGWPDVVLGGVLNWRAARLRHALDRALEAADADPTLTAAARAATLTVALLGYRSAAELSLTAPDDIGEEPAEFLAAARRLVTQLDTALRDLEA